MNHTLPEEYASVLLADGVDDNALLHMKNSTEGTSLNTRADGELQQSNSYVIYFDSHCGCTAEASFAYAFSLFPVALIS